MMISSIDLMDGRAVQLRQGKEKILEKEDALKLASEFDKYGEIAVIDIDAALGRGSNFELIKKILRISECRIGGGIKTVEQAKELVSYGAKSIIIGSKAFENDSVNHAFLNSFVSAIGRKHIIIAVDAINGEIVTAGWTHRTGLDLFTTSTEIEKYCSEMLFTCVEKEGMLQGIDMDMVKKLSERTKNKITVAGGVTTIKDIKTLAQMSMNAQVGMALYTGKITLEDGFIASLNWKNILLPTITQDSNGQVLMLAYSNKDSLRKTFTTGNMWYFSRSRNQLWMKGETSANIQELIRARMDCDADTILATVKQHGVACHTESYSCFGEQQFTLNELYEVLLDRIKNPKLGSYTATLTDELLNEKLAEESQELIDAKSRDEIIWEAADVLYFMTVLLARKNIKPEDILFELRRRRKK